MENPKLKVLMFSKNDVITTSSCNLKTTGHCRITGPKSDGGGWGYEYPTVIVWYNEATGKWEDGAVYNISDGCFPSDVVVGGIYRRATDGNYVLCEEDHPTN